MIKIKDRDILSSCLWGAAIGYLDIEADKFLIIERVLEHGGDRQIEFMLSNYSAEDIICVVKGSSYLSPKTVNYWCLFFNLKREDTKCYSRPFPHLWLPS